MYEATHHDADGNKIKTHLGEFLNNYPKVLNRQSLPDSSTYAMIYGSVLEKVKDAIYDVLHVTNRK